MGLYVNNIKQNAVLFHQQQTILCLYHSYIINFQFCLKNANALYTLGVYSSMLYLPLGQIFLEISNKKTRYFYKSDPSGLENEVKVISQKLELLTIVVHPHTK